MGMAFDQANDSPKDHHSKVSLPTCPAESLKSGHRGLACLPLALALTLLLPPHPHFLNLLSTSLNSLNFPLFVCFILRSLSFRSLCVCLISSPPSLSLCLCLLSLVPPTASPLLSPAPASQPCRVSHWEVSAESVFLSAVVS